MRSTGDGDKQNPQKQDDCENGVHILQHRFRHDEQDTDNHKRGNGDHDLPQVYVHTCDIIRRGSLQLGSEQGPDDDEHGRAVQEDNGQIGQGQKPGAQKCVVSAEGFLCICVDAAGRRPFPHQVDVIGRDDQNDGHADGHSNQRSNRSGYRQEGRSRHDKHTPADHAAKGDCPYV